MFKKSTNMYTLKIIVFVVFMTGMTVSAWAGNFTSNGDGTVTDNNTGLMWRQNSSTKYWVDALSYCENLDFAGHTDWRLPNIKELISIVDLTLYNPVLDTAYFTSSTSYHYWSSTTYTTFAGSAFIVNRTNGSVQGAGKNSYNYVFCLRDAQ